MTLVKPCLSGVYHILENKTFRKVQPRSVMTQAVEGQNAQTYLNLEWLSAVQKFLERFGHEFHAPFLDDGLGHVLRRDAETCKCSLG